MNYVLIHNDSNGVSRLSKRVWATQKGNFTPPSPGGYEISDTMNATGVLVMHHPAGYRDDWHCAPHPVLGTVLFGTIRIETSDGDSCNLRPGEQFVAADLYGKGHKIEETSLEPYNLALVVLADAPQPVQRMAT